MLVLGGIAVESGTAGPAQARYFKGVKSSAQIVQLCTEV